jgi:DNA replicative helicase MCM subunit Mcm2 (Cdc46/Mcm family)
MIDCEDLTNFDPQLFAHFLERPAECLPDFEDAAIAVVCAIPPSLARSLACVVVGIYTMDEQ